jgi:cell division protein FtsI (penicillin-binding protein 3)
MMMVHEKPSSRRSFAEISAGARAFYRQHGHSRLLLAGLMFAAVAAGALGIASKNGYRLRIGAPLAGRADIVDRNGAVLATSIVVPSLYADPRLVTNPRRAARALSELFPDQSEEEFEEKLSKLTGPH